MKIGDRIRQARHAIGYSQRDLAAAVGVTPGTVALWETGSRSPGRENLVKIAGVTLTDPSALMLDREQKSVLVDDPRQLALLRTFLVMNRRQQDNLLKLMEIAGDIGIGAEERRETALARNPPTVSGSIAQ